MRPSVWRWGALAAGLVLFAWLVRGIDTASLWAAVRSVSAAVWAAACVGIAISYALRGLRMQTELGSFVPVGYASCLRLMALHNLAVSVLPMRSGEAAYPLIVHRQFGLGVTDAAASLIWLRVQDVVVLAGLTLLLWPGLAVPLRVVGLFGMLAVVAWLIRRAQRTSTTTLAADSGAAKSRFGGLMHALGHHSRHTVRTWVYSVGHWSAKLLAIALLLATLAQVPLGHAMSAALAGEWAGASPVQGPAGLGTYEAALWAMLRIGSADGSNFVGAALAVHGFLLACTALSGLAALWSTPSPTPSIDDAFTNRPTDAPR